MCDLASGMKMPIWIAAKNKTKKKGDGKAKTLLLIDEMFLN
jgi:hypothetical protein